MNSSRSSAAAAPAESAAPHRQPKATTDKQKSLPSFNDILWCTDVDGDVMTTGMDVNMVRQHTNIKK